MFRDRLVTYAGWATLVVLIVANPEGAGDAFLVIVDTVWTVLKTVFGPILSGIMDGVDAVNRDANLGGN